MAQPTFDDAVRVQISALMQANSCAPERADRAARLACKAANHAIAAFEQALLIGQPGDLGQASDIGVGMMAIETGAQLVRDHMGQLAQRLHDLGRASGLPQFRGEILASEETHHG